MDWTVVFREVFAAVMWVCGWLFGYAYHRRLPPSYPHPGAIRVPRPVGILFGVVSRDPVISVQGAWSQTFIYLVAPPTALAIAGLIPQDSCMAWVVIVVLVSIPLLLASDIRDRAMRKKKT